MSSRPSGTMTPVEPAIFSGLPASEPADPGVRKPGSSARRMRTDKATSSYPTVRARRPCWRSWARNRYTSKAIFSRLKTDPTSLSGRNPRQRCDVPRRKTLRRHRPRCAGSHVNKEDRIMIRKIKEGYRVLSESGRNMGTYPTKEEAEKRLRQIEYFKHRKAQQ